VRHGIGCPHADEAGRELVEIGLAERDRAGLDQPRDGGGGALRREGKLRAGRRRGHAREVDVVLDRERQTPERLGDGIERSERFERMAAGIGCQADEHAGMALRGSQAVRRDAARVEPVAIRSVQGGTVEGLRHGAGPAGLQQCVAGRALPLPL